MMNLAEYRAEAAQLADYLPWGFLIAPGIILNKDGSFQRTLRYRGPDLDSATPEELVAVTARINNLLKRFGSGWVMFFEASRLPAQNYPSSEWEIPLGRLIDEERKAEFSGENRFFESRYYLTLLWRPPEDRTSRLESLLLDRENEDDSLSWRAHLTRFETETARAVDMLSGIVPELEELGDDDLLTYLHGAVSTSSHPVNAETAHAYLDCLLSVDPLLCGLEPMLGDEHLRVLTVQGLPPASEPGLLDEINRLGFSYRWMTRFIALDKTKASTILERKRRHWFAKRKSVLTLLKETIFKEASQLIDTDADNKAAETDLAMQDLGADAVAFGYVTTTLIVRDKDAGLAEEKRRRLEQIFNARGFVTIAETVNAVDAWVGSLPGQVYANIRQPLIHTLNLAHLSPMSSVWAGPVRNDHLGGPALLQAATDGTTPFRLVPHQGDVGHMAVVGPTGAGKSVLLSLIVAQFMRYNRAQVFFFDKGASARATIVGLEGRWSDLGDEAEAVFQPLRHIDNENERIWAAGWLLQLLTSEKITPTPDQKDAIWSALQSLADAPEEERTLTGLSLLLQDSDLKTALRPFTLSGPYGHVLDSDSENLSLVDVHGFEMEDLMQDERLVLPVLTYLFHRLDSRFDGRPSLLVLDEAWVFLDHPIFADQLRDWLKTLRKKNVSVIFATQSLADITSAKIAPALIESCPSRIFLPNPQALEPIARETYRSFSLNDRQIAMIAAATPKRDYYFQSRAGNRLFDLKIGPVALAFCGASSKEVHRRIDHCLTTLDGVSFAEVWLKENRLNWASDLIGNFHGHFEEENTNA